MVLQSIKDFVLYQLKFQNNMDIYDCCIGWSNNSYAIEGLGIQNSNGLQKDKIKVR